MLTFAKTNMAFRMSQQKKISFFNSALYGVKTAISYSLLCTEHIWEGGRGWVGDAEIEENKKIGLDDHHVTLLPLSWPHISLTNVS